MNLTIIGTGYVGLVAGACFADMGNNVICVDNDSKKIEQLKQGVIPIFEPGLEELVKSNLNENRLLFTTDIDFAVKNSQVCFIAVGTPQGENGAADLSRVFDVAEKIAQSINEYKLIVNKSTVPVGTAQKISEIIRNNTTYPFDVVSNPEFLKQGNAVDDFLSPDRILIGSNSENAACIMQEIYSPFLRTANRIIFMDVKSAEMTKYASNTFLATKISFMNEIAMLCEKIGADVEMVRTGMAADTRIGKCFLFPGIGYGGSCFPKDIAALINTGKEFDTEMSLLKTVSSINYNQRLAFVKKITDKYGDDLSGKNFGVWGLAFKPKTNDMREAPSVTIIQELLKRGAKIKAYDPKAMDTSKEFYLGNSIKYANNSYEAVESADALLLLTEWNEFRRPDFDRMKSIMNSPVIFDGRNQYDPVRLKEKGFEYLCIGR